jgi:hypothetical protein
MDRLDSLLCCDRRCNFGQWTPTPMLITATAHFMSIRSEPKRKVRPDQRFAGCQR